MFGRTYSQTCCGCNTVFRFNKAKDSKKFSDDHDGCCPCCGWRLSQIPLIHIMLTPPPELKCYPEYVRMIDMDGDVARLLDFNKWTKGVR